MLKRIMSIERVKDMRAVNENHEAELSFSSETDSVERRCETPEMRSALKANSYREIIDHDNMDLSFLRAGGSLLKNHDPEQIIGAVDSATVDKNDRKGRAKVRFTTTQAGKDAETEVNEGALRSVSFGYEHDASKMRMIARGEKYDHYGKSIKGPAILVGVRALEISLTPIPADSTVGVGRSKEDSGEETTPMLLPEVRKHIRSTGAAFKLSFREIRDIEDAAPETVQEADDLIQSCVNERSTTPTVSTPAAPTVAAPVAFNSKTVTLRAREAGLSDAEIVELISTCTTDEAATTAIAAKKQARAAAAGPVSNPSNIAMGDDAFDKAMNVIEGSIATTVYQETIGSKPGAPVLTKDGYVMRGRGDTLTPTKFQRMMGDNGGAHEPEREGGPDEFVEWYQNTFKPSARRQMDPIDIGRTYLRALGERDLDDVPRSELIKSLFSEPVAQLHRDKVRGRSIFVRDGGSAQIGTTASFPNLLQNVQNKILRRPYQRAQPSWSRWCKKGSLKDFKPGSRIALSDAGDLLIRKENEQPKSANFSDETETIRLDDYARKYDFTWEMMLSDDLGGMARNLLAISRSVLRLPSIVLTKAMLSNSGTGPTMGDGNAWLDATNHKNYDATSGGAFSATSLNTAITAMRKMTGKVAPQDNTAPIGGIVDNLNLEPWGILAPPDLILAITKLFGPNYYANLTADGGGGAGALYFAGGTDMLPRLQVVIEPRLSNTSFTSANNTRWYLFSDPQYNDHWELAFLNGSDEPIIRTVQDFQNLGMTTTCHLPVGAAPLEWRTVQGQIGQ